MGGAAPGDHDGGGGQVAGRVRGGAKDWAKDWMERDTAKVCISLLTQGYNSSQIWPPFLTRLDMIVVRLFAFIQSAAYCIYPYMS